MFWPAREGGCCYRCLFPEPPPAAFAPNCAEASVLGVLPGVIGLLQATEAIKLILGIGESLPKSWRIKCGTEASVATARDLFDLSLVIERDPDALLAAGEFLIRHRDTFIEQLATRDAFIRQGFSDIRILNYTPTFDHAVALATKSCGKFPRVNRWANRAPANAERMLCSANPEQKRSGQWERAEVAAKRLELERDPEPPQPFTMRKGLSLR